MLHADSFEIGIPLSRDFYLNYMLTETNVAAALRRGVSRAEIKDWCAETLAQLWPDTMRTVLFGGYFVGMLPARP